MPVLFVPPKSKMTKLTDAQHMLKPTIPDSTCLFNICRTRAVFVEVSMYNVNTDLYTSITLCIEFPLTGNYLY